MMEDDARNDPKVAAVYEHLKEWVDGTNKLDASSVVILVTKVIGLVQEMVPEHGNGEYKKKVAMTVIRMVVEDSDLEAEAKASLSLVIETTVPSMIDAMIAIAKEEIDIGKAVESIKNSGCFPCFK